MNTTKNFVWVMLLAFFLVQFYVPEAIAGIQCYARDSYSVNFIIAVQETLRSNGIDSGPVDGLWGSKTEHGVAAFQRSEGLSVIYDLNGPTLRALFGENFDPERYGLVPNPEMPSGIFEEHCR
jgi:Putative peptidoglycan binding domain